MDRISDIESGSLSHLNWMEDLCVDSSEYSTSPRMDSEYSITGFSHPDSTPDLYRVVSWSEFSSSSASLSEWDEEIQFYEEDNDEFRKWATRYKLQFETVSLLRSLQLDDMKSLGAINHYQLRMLRGSGGFEGLTDALKSLHISPDRWDELREEELIGDAEFSLKPRIHRNMPLRRSTRSAKKTKHHITVRGNGIQTIGPGSSRSRYTADSRRLSWEAFAFLNNGSNSKSPSQGSSNSSGSGVQHGPVSPKSAKIMEQFRYNGEQNAASNNSSKKESVGSKKTKAYFPSVTPL